MLFFKDKKAVELSLNTIIIAAIVIIVFIVMVYLVTNKLGYFSTTINKCEYTGPLSRDVCLNQGGIPKGQYFDEDGRRGNENEVCCKLPSD